MSEIQKNASTFMEELFHVYLKERDFEKFISMLDENINWLSINKKKLCENVSQLKVLLDSEEKYKNIKFNITKLNISSTEISEDLCVVYGEIEIQSEDYKLLIADKSVFYAVCKAKDRQTLVLSQLIFSKIKKILNKKRLAEENEMSAESEYITSLEKKMKEQTAKNNEELLISEKKFEAMVKYSHAIVYEYILAIDEMIFPHELAEQYDLPMKFKNATADPVWRKILSEEAYNVFQKYHALARKGVKDIYETISATDKFGVINTYDVCVRGIRNKEGIPLKALIILTDVTHKSIGNSSRIEIPNTIKIGNGKDLENSNLYEFMFSRSENVYEVNISKNLIVKGQENWIKKIGIKAEDSYTQVIKKVAKHRICKDDVKDFLKAYERDNAIIEYIGGNREIVTEYRRINDAGNAFWVKSTMYLYEDNNTGDIRAVISIVDINEEKLQQLELVYCAEHDQLTKTFNKTKTQHAIDEFLNMKEGSEGKHAFFIIDLDYFKEVNDSLGHAFGDVVLSSTTSKLKTIFRESDIIGRIGGDEFVVFMKNISTPQDACAKAKELCDEIRDVFKQNQKLVPISSSVGIAFYPQHADNYEDLYKLSDIGLYAAKESGRNRYVVYNKDLTMGEKKEKPIDTSDFFEINSFESDPSKYIFRILYETGDKIAAINTVLELSGKHFKASRAYICEKDYGKNTYSNTFEWCAKKVKSKKEVFQKVSSEGKGGYLNFFNEHGIFYLPSLDSLDEEKSEIFKSQKIKSMLQFLIRKKETFNGIVGFDYCENEFTPSKHDITMLNSISNILGVFLEQVRALKAAVSMRDTTMQVLNNLDTSVYISDKETHKILFMNKNAENLINNTKLGDLCHSVFRNLEKPCVDCPMKADNGKNNEYYVEINNEDEGVHMYVATKFIYWIDGSGACMHECTKLGYFDELKRRSSVMK